MKRLKNKKDDLVRAWWEEEQAKGETADEGFHLKSSTEGHLAFYQPGEFLFFNSFHFESFKGWLATWIRDLFTTILKFLPGDIFIHLLPIFNKLRGKIVELVLEN